MARTISIGCQSFEIIRTEGYFYIDKTMFIKEWWEGGDSVTLINRPRRFGKTLTMSMVEQFFSVSYEKSEKLFDGLAIWEYDKFRKLQGTYPVLSLSFANVKERDYSSTIQRINQIIVDLYHDYGFLRESDALLPEEKEYLSRISDDMPEVTATMALHRLAKLLYKHYKKRVVILLDEYDTPMQEAYVNGYWEKLTSFTRSMFNSTFKTNPYLERAIMTGITRVSRESIFSDLNNLKVVTTTSDEYADCFGFTEREVFAALDEFGMTDRRQEVKRWYDGFTFGSQTDIYNPWSILNYLDTRRVGTYWANSSSNSLVGKLLREGSADIKKKFEGLLCGEHLLTPLDEQIVYGELDSNEAAVWSLLLASGYLKVIRCEEYEDEAFSAKQPNYELALTNREVLLMFQNMVRAWFQKGSSYYNDFIKALLKNDLDAMNDYMNHVALSTFSYFDTGERPSGTEPERFYHGFVLGLMVELADRYVLTSNRESGFGRYDVMLEPRDLKDDAFILEFKVFQPRKEKGLADTVQAALRQIEEKNYAVMLIEKGAAREQIRKYGFGFRGSEVLIEGG